jgi:Flp pilus assembly protein TadG
MVRRNEAGASAVEFALVLPILVLFIFGIIEFGLAYNRVQSFQAAAREAGRLASVGVDVTTGETNARIRAIAGSTVDNSKVVVAVDQACPASYTGAPVFVTAVVSLNDPTGVYAIKIPFIEPRSPDFEAEAVFRCERR